MPGFPDLLHLEQLRRRLWVGREYGQAAVMVGAGFSVNAKPRHGGAAPFLLWSDLARNLYEELYPAAGEPPEDYARRADVAIANSGVLRLAYEYETVFGRAALDTALARSVPDDQYMPGELHHMLLSLPWSDVFTTNYDTLLERAREDVHDRKYDLILRQEEFPGRSKPRIIKLHGSLPSFRPLVITEEDYRTYPTRFAPLVNTVQQALMENALVLLGFSGDDANFLQWAGWVRDRLGSSCPPAYLCGVLELSTSRRQVLNALNVKPIDLAPLFPGGLYATPIERHKAATRWLLLTLFEGKPPEVTRWPKLARKHRWASDGLPAIPPGPSDLRPEFLHPPVEGDWVEIATSLTRVWRANRLLYPGWLIAPPQNVLTLRAYTQYWIEPIFANLEQLPIELRLDLLVELVWRMDRALLPLDKKWAEAISEVLESRPPAVNTHLQPSGPGATAFSHADWTTLALALARRGREDGDADFVKWSERLAGIGNASAELRHRLSYEKCLFHCYRGEYLALKQVLAEWDPLEGDIAWQLRRAGLLAELGDVHSAVHATEQALISVRRAQVSQPDSIGLISREAFCMWLLRHIATSPQGEPPELEGRWSQMAAYEVNPARLFEYFASELERPRVLPQSITTRIDPYFGEVVSTEHWSTTEAYVVRPGFAWIRLYDEAGIPARVQRMMFAGESSAHAASDVAPFSIWMAALTVLRRSSSKEVERWFDKPRLAQLPQDLADILYESFSGTLRRLELNAHRRQRGLAVDEDGLDPHTVEVHTKLLGRMLFRVSHERQVRALELVLDVAEARIAPSLGGDRGFSELFALAAEAVGREEFLSRASRLLQLPIPGIGGMVGYEWAEPGTTTWWQTLFKRRDLVPTIDAATVQWLINVVSEHRGDARRAAVSRLLPLARAAVLSEEQLASFLAALMMHIDEYGLPAETGYAALALLTIREWRATIEPRLREYLLSAPLPAVGSVDGDRVTVSGPQGRTVLDEMRTASRVRLVGDEEEPLVDWSRLESERILSRAIDWWSAARVVIERVSDGPSLLFGYRNPLAMCERVVVALSQVVLPRLEPDSDHAQAADGLLTEMSNYGAVVAPALGELARLIPSRRFEYERNLLRALSSREERVVLHGAFGAYLWLLRSAAASSAEGIDAAAPEYLLDEFVSRVHSRRRPGLEDTIHFVSELLSRAPNLFSERHLRELCTALEFLLSETRLPTELERARDREALPEELIYRLPMLQARASRLAFALQNLIESRPTASPCASTPQWRRYAAASTLPEVRASWDGDSNGEADPHNSDVQPPDGAT